MKLIQFAICFLNYYNVLQIYFPDTKCYVAIKYFSFTNPIKMMKIMKFPYGMEMISGCS